MGFCSSFGARVGVWAVSAVFCGVAVSAASAAEVLSDTDRLAFADALLSRGIYDKAAKEYKSYLESASYIDGGTTAAGMDRVYYNLGSALSKSGDSAGAAEAFGKVMSDFKGSKFFEAAKLGAASSYVKTDKTKAEQLYSQIISESSDAVVRPEALYGRAVLRSENGNADGAAADLDELVNKYPSHRLAPYACVSLGGIFASDAKHHDYARAEQLLSEALKSKDKLDGDLAAEAQYFFACAQYGLGKNREAAASFKEFLSDYPESRHSDAARLRMAWAYFASGMYVEAREVAEEALSAGAGDSAGEFLYIAGSAFFELRQNPQALACYRKGVEVDPEGKFAERSIYRAARTLYNMRNFEECISELKPIMESESLRYDALWLSADAARIIKDSVTAQQNYGLLVKEFPNSPRADDAMFRMGYSLREASRWNDAATIFMDLYAKFPKSELAPKAVFLAASAYDSAEDERALGAYRLYLEKFPRDPDVPAALFRCGMVEIRRDLPNEALRTLDKLISYYPDWDMIADAHLWRATILARQGDYNGAAEAFKKSMSLNPSTETMRIARFSLSLALMKLGRGDDAVKLMLELVDDPMLSDYSHEQLKWLSESLYSRNIFDKSESVAMKLFESAPDPAWKQTALDLAGHAVLAQEGRRDDARKLFEDAASIESRTRYGIDALYSLGVMYYEDGKYLNAEKNFADALNRIGDSADFGDLRLLAYSKLACLSALSGDDPECERRAYMVMVLFDCENEAVAEAIGEITGVLRKNGKNELADSIKEQYDRMRAGGAAETEGKQ